MKRAVACAVLICACLVLSGCGETLHGIQKDLQRMGKGMKTIFIRED